ncbi:MAG: TolC family protein [Nitrospirota bacterium]
MKRSFLFSFFVFFLGVVPSVAYGSEPPIALALSDAILMAIQNNPDIKIEQENIVSHSADVLSEQSEFDPSFRSHIQRTTNKSGSFSVTEPTIAEHKGLEAGLTFTKPLSWGGEVDLSLSQLRTDATFQRLNPAYQSNISLKWTQPLLRGFGKKMKQGKWIIANTKLEMAHHLFHARLMEIILKVVSLYWELIFQIENLSVQKDSLKLAKQLLEINETKVKLGVMAPIEILVAESSVASREEAVIVAQKGVRDTEDQLGALIGLWGERPLREDGREFSKNILPSDPPIDKAVDLNSNLLLDLALTKRPEIAAKQLEIQNNDVAASIAKNKLRSSLDFVAAWGPTGTGQNFLDAVDQGASLNFYRWEAGLFWNIPIGNHAAEALFLKETSAGKRSLIGKEKLQSDIRLDVREGARRVGTDFERIKATGRARDLARKQLSAASERFSLGLLSSRDLITFQNDVTVSDGHALRAIIDYNKSLGNLDRVTGRLLEKYQIEMASP